MEEGKDYLLRPHPAPRYDDHWVVIMRNEPYQGVCIEFSNVVISAMEEGRTDRDLTYTVHVNHNPNELDLEAEEFQTYVSDVIRDVVETHHERNANIYVSTKTGERI
jgi:hypothetical protein